jgi:O-antigen/teichoic acid export membrane protein
VEPSSPDLKQAWLNSAATVLVKGSLAAARVIFLLWAARRIGPDAFGRLALCFAIVEILRMVVDFGTENLFLRSLARSDSRADQAEQLARFGVFRIAATTAGLLVYWGAVEVVLRNATTLIDLLPGALIFTSAGMGYALTYYQSQLRMRRAALLLLPVALMAATVFILMLPDDAATLLGLLIAFELTAVVMFLVDMSREGLFSSTTSRQAAHLRTGRDVIFASLPLAAVALLATAYTRLDVLVIAPLAGSVALGLYSYAYRISEPFRFLASAADSTLYSYLSARVDGVGKVELVRLLLAVLSYGSFFAIAAVLSGWLLVHLGYEDYRDALPTLGVLGIALFLRCVNGFLTSLLYARGLYKTVLKIAICNALLMTATIYPAVAAFGIVGAAASLLAVEILNCFLQSRAASAAAGQNVRSFTGTVP